MISTLSVTSHTNLKQSGSEMLVIKVNISEDSDEATQKMHMYFCDHYSGLGWPISIWRFNFTLLFPQLLRQWEHDNTFWWFHLDSDTLLIAPFLCFPPHQIFSHMQTKGDGLWLHAGGKEGLWIYLIHLKFRACFDCRKFIHIYILMHNTEDA